MREIVVIGSGVIGLSCAITLRERGHAVRVVSGDDPAHTTSAAAASLWALPLVEQSERVRRWAYDTLARLRRDAPLGTGVRSLASRTVSTDPTTQDPWMASFLPAHEIGVDDALPAPYRHVALSVIPLVDTRRYIPWLVAECGRLGIERELRSIQDLTEVDADTVILATGAQTPGLVPDSGVHVRSARVVRAFAPQPPRRVTIVRDGPFAGLFIVPRFDDVIVGGAGLDDADPRDLIDVAARFEPALTSAQVLTTAVGHRPLRDTIALHAEAHHGRRVVHCYGHGGAGFALSWGTASAAADLVEAS